VGGLAAFALLSLLPAPLHPEALRADAGGDYASLLARVVRDDGVDYRALAAGRAGLDAYVRSLEAADPGATDDDRIAFWINAHNALALQQALDKRHEWRVAGREATLDGIGEILEGFREPLVRFALHRAARSSPPLSAVPYAGTGLREALAPQARAYLGDPERNLFDYAQLRAELSMLLLRHREEFEGGREGPVPPLQLFLADHLPKERDPAGQPRESAVARSLRTTPWRISFRPWDGSLDEAGRAKTPLHPVWIVLYGIAAAALLLLGFRAFRRPPLPPVPPHPPDG
jgi:hypothetical protein